MITSFHSTEPRILCAVLKPNEPYFFFHNYYFELQTINSVSKIINGQKVHQTYQKNNR